MANLKSQQKNIKTEAKKYLRKKIFLNRVKNLYKKIQLLLNDQKNKENKDLHNSINSINSLLDKAESKNYFHKNKVSRFKSKIMLKYNLFLNSKNK